MQRVRDKDRIYQLFTIWKSKYKSIVKNYRKGQEIVKHRLCNQLDIKNMNNL